MKYIFILLLLQGCAQLAPSWPQAPNIGSCPPLQLAEPSEKLSTLLNTVIENYEKYHNCSAKVEAWQEWYRAQKHIHETR